MSGALGFLSPKGRVLPIVTVVAIVIVLWYALAVCLNYAACPSSWPATIRTTATAT